MEHQRGFTLIELMITVAVVAILAAIALPSYQNFIIRGNRSAAEQFMLDVATREQQLLLDSRKYVAVSSTANFASAPPTGISLAVPTTTTGKYDFKVINVDNSASPPTFQVYATAIGSQSSDGDLTLDQSGTKLPASKW